MTKNDDARQEVEPPHKPQPSVSIESADGTGAIVFGDWSKVASNQITQDNNLRDQHLSHLTEVLQEATAELRRENDRRDAEKQSYTPPPYQRFPGMAEMEAELARHQELQGLERKIAYDAARSEIEINCLTVEPTHEEDVNGETFRVGEWYDLEDGPTEEAEDASFIEERVRYLDLLGKLERRPDAPHIVRILDL